MGKASNGEKREISAPIRGRTPNSAAIPTSGSLISWANSLTIHILLVVLLGFLCYSNTFDVPFQWDDKYGQLLGNPIVKDLSYFIDPSKAKGFASYSTLKSRYIGYLTFALNYKLHGINVKGYHIFNLTVHILSAISFYFFVLLTYRTPFLKTNNQWGEGTIKRIDEMENKEGIGSLIRWLADSPKAIALFSALLFVAHPVQTQAVTYIMQRFASLATLFYLGSIVLYVKWRLMNLSVLPSLKRKFAALLLYCTAVLFCILSMLTKQTAFTLPLVIGLYEFSFFIVKARSRLIYLAPFLLTMLIIPMTIIEVDRPLHEIAGDLGEKTAIVKISRLDYLMTEFRVIVTYIRLLFIPINQNLYYDYPLYHSIFEPPVFLSLMFVLLISCLGVYFFYRSRITHRTLRIIAFGIFWFFITLSVESSIIPLHPIFEHRLYLASVGAFLAITTGIALLLVRIKNKPSKALLAPSLILIPLVLATATYARNKVWQSELTLWWDVVKKSPAKAMGHDNLGNVYRAKGLTDKAIEQYKTALRLDPGFVKTYNNLGNAYRDKGLTDKAIEQYKTALKWKPDYTKAHYNIGVAYYSKGLFDEAIKHLETALQLRPDFAEAHNNLSIVYGSIGLFDEAIKHLETALQLRPDFAKAHYNLGLAYLKKGLMDKARREFEAAIKIDPSFNDALQYLNR